ncbi:MAG TPA: protein-glutamate O-methyltransferase CheR, partial [Planctomycetaceae bacterium]|nr:protein-glutamate O-methyltransferase CheR [Planctomycetaceae bacterium]
VNETYFFREYPQLEAFANEALPRVAESKRRRGDYDLNLWCAACSTGEEAYTLAIIIHACLDDIPRWNVRILATDIDRQALAAAREGAYGDRSVKNVPDVYYRKYFRRQNGRHCVCESIKRMVTLRQMNLLDKDTMRRQRGYDFIFCRNVLIYFDDRSRKRVLASFYDALVPGGFVFLGHSESVGRISAAFCPVRLGQSIGYCKPASGTETTREGVQAKTYEETVPCSATCPM